MTEIKAETDKEDLAVKKQIDFLNRTIAELRAEIAALKQQAAVETRMHSMVRAIES